MISFNPACRAGLTALLMLLTGVLFSIKPQASELTSDREVDRHIAAVLLGSAPLLKDPAALEYVNRVGRWLTLQTDRADHEWRFGVLNSPTIHAFSTPDGTVLITRGLMELLRNETELAGVLSHEIAHVVQGDYDAPLLGSVADANQLAATVRMVYADGLGADVEYRADKLAVVIAARAGYDPYGLPGWLQALDAAPSGDPDMQGLLQSHPAPEQRLANLLPAMQALPALVGSSDINSDFSNLAAGTAAGQPQALDHRHPDAKNQRRGEASSAGNNGQPATGSAVTEATMPEPAMSSEVSLANIQRLLQARGFDPGNDHGQLTQQTQLSIMEYENANGLPVDGQPDPVFIKHLLNQQ